MGCAFVPDDEDGAVCCCCCWGANSFGKDSDFAPDFNIARTE